MPNPPQNPEAARSGRSPAIDIISDVLQAVRLRGATFFQVSANSPWVAEAPRAEFVAPLVMPDAQSIIEYHVVTAGSCWASIAGSNEEPIKLSKGSIIVFPQGDAHVLSSHPGMRGTPSFEIFRAPEENAELPFHLSPGGDGPVGAEMICGFLGYDSQSFNPLVQSLPRILHVADGYAFGDSWLGHLIDATVKESSERRMASSAVLSKLSELIFIEVIRRHAESLPNDAQGWLAALRDPHVGAAIRLIHQNPGKDWTIAELGRRAGLSRTALAERFTKHVGMPPISYLTKWRLQLASGLLSGTFLPIAQIAEQVGYESEASFSKSFKRSFGVSPSGWRRSAAQGGRQPPGGSGDISKCP